MRLAKIATYIFHPVFMPIIGIYLILNSGIDPMELTFDLKKFVYLVTFCCTLLLPLSLVIGLMLFSQIQSIKLTERKERVLPLIFTTIFFYAAYFFVARFFPVIEIKKVLISFLYSISMVSFLLLSVSMFWKISIHLAGIGGIVGLIAFLSVIYFSIDFTVILCSAIFIAGLLFSSRLKLNEHTPIQLIAGFILGFSTVLGLLFKINR